MKKLSNNLEQNAINCLKMLSVEAVNKANSGHPGIAIGAAPLIYTLFNKHINNFVDDLNWINRDRFILSAGHGSALLYSILHLAGFPLTIKDLKQFRQVGSKTPGHPENILTKGVESVTGPLGQGVGVLVGIALAESILSKKFNEDNFNIIDNYTYGIVSDGDLQEGISYEVTSLAGHWKLNKLIVLYDSNDVQLDGFTNTSFSDSIKKRFESLNWNYLKVDNGNDINSINDAIIQAKKSKDKPTIIEIKTIIGQGTTNQGTNKVHGAPIGDDIKILRKNLNWNRESFSVPNEVYKIFKDNFFERSKNSYNRWQENLNKYKLKYPDKFKLLNKIIKNDKSVDFSNIALEETKEEATRVSSGKIITQLAKDNFHLIGGSADLASSTKVIGGDGFYSYSNRCGRNISYGVREFGMAAINNGLGLYGGIIPFCGEFFIFADYLKPALRLCSLMELQSIYIFTHDSILLGEDGPTHQPVEQLAMFRAQPNVNVFRPADYKETLGVYKYILTNEKSFKTPSALVLSRQNLPQLKNTKVESIAKGGYIVKRGENSKITIIATGSELHIALKLQEELKLLNKIEVNVVSMVSFEVFDRQNKNYKEEIIPKNHRKISIEFQSTFGWHKYVGNEGLTIGYDNFGHSGKAEDILKHIKLDYQNIYLKIINFLKK